MVANEKLLVDIMDHPGLGTWSAKVEVQLLTG